MAFYKPIENFVYPAFCSESSFFSMSLFPELRCDSLGGSGVAWHHIRHVERGQHVGHLVERTVVEMEVYLAQHLARARPVEELPEDKLRGSAFACEGCGGAA